MATVSFSDDKTLCCRSGERIYIYILNFLNICFILGSEEDDAGHPQTWRQQAARPRNELK
jgi:hypothetical protein